MENIEKLEIVDLDGTKHIVQKAGLLFAYAGPQYALGLPLTLLVDAAKIPDYGRQLKRPTAIMNRVRMSGYHFETRYDAPHGRRYMLGCYRAEGMTLGKNKAQQRRVVIAAMDGIALETYGDRGAQISGCVRDHFSSSVKDELRALARLVSEEMDKAKAAWPYRAHMSTVAHIGRLVATREGVGFYGPSSYQKGI